MRKNEGKLCLQCGQALQADTCDFCKLLWGCKQLSPELEAFTSFAHNAKLSPEKLAELESLLENFGKVAISMRSMQEAARRGLTFVEPANEQRKRLKSLAKYNRSFVPQPPIIERSLPEITQAIKRAYQLADDVLRSIGSIRYHKVELSTFRSMLFAKESIPIALLLRCSKGSRSKTSPSSRTRSNFDNGRRLSTLVSQADSERLRLCPMLRQLTESICRWIRLRASAID